MRRLMLWCLLPVWLLAGCAEEGRQLQKGQPLPAFDLQRLDGAPLAFPADLRGKVVALRFWADWCPFCEGEMRAIEPVYQAYRDQGLVILAINVRQDPDTAAAFIEPLGISYKVLLDRQGSVARDYGVMGLPTTFFMDRQGRLDVRILGESTPEVFEGIVRKLL